MGRGSENGQPRKGLPARPRRIDGRGYGGQVWIVPQARTGQLSPQVPQLEAGAHTVGLAVVVRPPTPPSSRSSRTRRVSRLRRIFFTKRFFMLGLLHTRTGEDRR